MDNATATQPLTDRIERSTPEGRIAEHVRLAAECAARQVVSEVAPRLAS